MKPLIANIRASELLTIYGYEQYKDTDVLTRWRELTSPWHPDNSMELGDLRQLMLRKHQEVCPDDDRWISI